MWFLQKQDSRRRRRWAPISKSLAAGDQELRLPQWPEQGPNHRYQLTGHHVVVVRVYDVVLNCFLYLYAYHRHWLFQWFNAFGSRILSLLLTTICRLCVDFGAIIFNKFHWAVHRVCSLYVCLSVCLCLCVVHFVVLLVIPAWWKNV